MEVIDRFTLGNAIFISHWQIYRKNEVIDKLIKKLQDIDKFAIENASN